MVKNNKGAKAAVITAAVGAGGFTLFWLLRKARAGEADARAAAGKYKSAAEAAAVEAAQQKAAADAAGRLAANAAVAANNAVMQSKALTAEANALALQAQNERDATKRVALQREAALKAGYASQLAANAKTAQETAARATAEAHARDAAAAKATAVAAKPAVQQQIVDDGAAALERKRLAVVDGYQRVLAAVKQQNPSFTEQKAVNTAAAFLRKQGINIDKPDPTLSFWKLPEDEIRRRVLVAVNAYLVAKPPGPAKSSPKAPTVSTKVDPAKLDAVQRAYLGAIEYTVARYEARGKKLSSAEAYAIIAEPFRRGSSLAPGAAAVPAANQLEAPSPFWANPLSTVQAAMRAAGDAARREVDARLSDVAGFGASEGSTAALAVVGFGALAAIIAIPLAISGTSPERRRHG